MELECARRKETLPPRAALTMPLGSSWMLQLGSAKKCSSQVHDAEPLTARG